MSFLKVITEEPARKNKEKSRVMFSLFILLPDTTHVSRKHLTHNKECRNSKKPINSFLVKVSLTRTALKASQIELLK